MLVIFSFFFFCSLSTAIYLAAYIVDLTLVLYGIFTEMVANPLESLSLDFVLDVQALYKSRSSLIHVQVKEAAPKLEERIGGVIMDGLRLATFI